MQNKRKRKKIDEDFTNIQLNRGFVGTKIISEASELLHFNINGRYKAIVLFHKYTEDCNFIATIIASLNISNKLEEQNKTLKQIIYVVSYLRSIYEGSTTIYVHYPTINYSQYVELKEQAIKVELEILLENNFNIQFEDLYGCFVEEIKDLGEGEVLRSFTRLNSLLFSYEIIFLSPFEVLKIIKDDELYNLKVAPLQTLKHCKIDFNSFKATKRPLAVTDNLLKGFLKK